MIHSAWVCDPAEMQPQVFTGQYSYMDDPSTPGSEGFGLMYYGARWYDASLGRFAQADSIVPTSTQGTQAWDRYAYTNSNPVNYNDPTGHYMQNDNSTRPNVGGEIIEKEEESSSGDCNTTTNRDANGKTCHNYQVTNPVCLNLSWIHCTPDEVAAYMARFQYPGQWPGSPVVNNENYDVAPAEFWGVPTPLCYVGLCDSGAITVGIQDGGLTITNYTQDTHIFDVGDVQRTGAQDANGNWIVTSNGSGSNNGFGIIPGHAIDYVNQRIGPLAFGAVDLQLVAYTTVAETWQYISGLFH